MQRKDAILLAASDHFGRFGFRGASLRHIARDASVSLTLLNHHFGSKGDMLMAVVDRHRPILDQRVVVLRRLTAGGIGTFTPHDLVQAWIRIDSEAATQPEGQLFLRLLARVIDDPAEDGLPIARDGLDPAALAFVDALQTCYPQASRHAVASAYLWVSASLSKFLTGTRQVLRLADADRADLDDRADLVGRAGEPAYDDDQARLARFLVAGIDASLGETVPLARRDLSDAVN